MKRAILWTLFLLLLFPSCMKTTIIGEPLPIEQVDTVVLKKPHRPQTPSQDTTETDDRIPIGFNPSVQDWEDTDINLEN